MKTFAQHAETLELQGSCKLHLFQLHTPAPAVLELPPTRALVRATVKLFTQTPSFQVKMPLDMPDDILKDAIATSQQALADCANFEADGLEVRGRNGRLWACLCAHAGCVWMRGGGVGLAMLQAAGISHAARDFAFFSQPKLPDGVAVAKPGEKLRLLCLAVSLSLSSTFPR